ncbi:MAG: hypothetical protein ABJH08_02205 [Balneola sp.]
MIYKFSSLVLLSIFGISLASCDESLTPKDLDENQPYVQKLQINPSSIDFDLNSDGQKDTTITLDLEVDGFNFKVDSVPYYSIFVGEESLPSIQGKFLVNFSQLTTFQANINIPTNTLDFETYTVLVTPKNNGSGQNYAQAIVKQSGVSFNAPEVLSVNNPDEVERPESGETTVYFTAKVSDTDGQNNIDGVFLRLISQTSGEVNNSPFQLFDDGSSRGDLIASDSIYTLIFPVNSSNQLQTYDIKYYAKDKSGLVSDTVTTTFSIVDNE